MRRTARTHMAALGIDRFVAADALQHLQAEPRANGAQAVELLCGELALATLPVIALSAGALSSARQKASDAGMDDDIVKPFDARQRFAGDFVLFLSLLRCLLAEFADVTLATPEAASPVARALRGAHMHKLRGIAGMWGARAIQRDAGAAEQAGAAGDGDGAMRFGASPDAQLRRLGEQAASTLAAAATTATEAAALAQRRDSRPLQAHALQELRAAAHPESVGNGPLP